MTSTNDFSTHLLGNLYRGALDIKHERYTEYDVKVCICEAQNRLRMTVRKRNI
jgi:hypothetical protein